jgi:hypothetical protein
MASGFVFVYLMIAAVAAPLLWLMWWAADSLSDAGRLQASAAPIRGSVARNPEAGRPRFKQPQPVDFSLARPSGAVTIHRLTDAAQIGACVGPDSAGKCPRALADGTVPCAGAVLALPRRIRGSAEWHIPSGYHACLLGSYDAFRQPGSPT